MNNKKKLTLLFLAGLLTGWLSVGFLSAYNESDGGWSSSEKRQIISLLEKIAENTRP